MTEPRGISERLREIYRTTGATGVGSSITDYVRWRLAGSPPDPLVPVDVRLEQTDAAVVVALMRDFYASASIGGECLVSVIVPTKDRPDTLTRAIDSVFSQVHSNWELIVVNDSTAPLSPIPDDPRIRVIESGGAGVAAARNLGLDTAAGAVITYLDDDNLMDPLWLAAVALTLDQAPETEIMIGAQLVTPEPRAAGHHAVRFPARFDWDQLIKANYVDMGMLAHRAGLGVKFDEELPALVDWDYVVRLTKDSDPVLVPAVSGLYLTGSPGRISYRDRQKLLRDTRERFSKLRRHTPSEAASAIGQHDLSALTTMVDRLAQVRQRDLAVLIATETPLTGSVGEAMASMSHACVVSSHDQRVDMILTGALPEPATLSRLADDGFVIGLEANRVDYGLIGLPHGRPIGDHLWVGSMERFEPESLFDGATLVKLGVDDHRPPTSD